MKHLKHHGYLYICILCVFASLGAFLYGRFIEPKLLVVKEYSIVPQEKNQSLQGLKIGIFSDTHLGFAYTPEQLEKVVDTINQQEYDILLFLGDLIDNYQDYIKEHPEGEKNRQKIVAVLGKTESKYGKFAVFGNHDLGAMGQWDYPIIMKEAGFQVLQNSHIQLEINEAQLNIIGLDDWMLGVQDTESAFANLIPGDFQLLLAHEPDVIDEIISKTETPLHLFIAGHSHGGQVRLPFFQETFMPPYAKKYIRGWYKTENTAAQETTDIFVTSGIGSTGIPFRFLNVPEIITIHLE